MSDGSDPTTPEVVRRPHRAAPPFWIAIGIALDTTDSVLFVSALDPSSLTDIVIKVDLKTKEPTTLDTPDIKTFSEAAGLHRRRHRARALLDHVGQLVAEELVAGRIARVVRARREVDVVTVYIGFGAQRGRAR